MENASVNKAKLTRLLRDFYEVTGVRITFWLPDGKRSVVCADKDDSEFCSLVKSHKDLHACCSECDQQAIQIVKNTSKMHIFTCHAGLEEYVHPVLQNGNLLGFLMIGQVQLMETDPQEMKHYLEKFQAFGLNPQDLFLAYQALPRMSHASMLCAARMLEAVACYTYLNGMVRLIEPPLLAKIEKYVDEHLADPLNLNTISSALFISRSKLCHYIRAEMNTSVIKLVNRKRIDAVKQALVSGKSLQESAEMYGFSSVSYCSRVFKNLEGVSPESYLRRLAE